MSIKRALNLAAFPLLLLALFVGAYIFREPIVRLFSSLERFRDWIRASGNLAPLIFMLVQALQVVIFLIPGEIPQVAGGYLFGFWYGVLLSLAGITVGSGLSFLASRFLGVPFVHAIFSPDQVDRIRHLASGMRARIIFFLLFLIPGVPKDILCYAAGISSFRLAPFMLLSTLGRLPGILGSALIGNAARQQRWILAVVVFAISCVLFLAGLLARSSIESFLQRLSRRS